MKNNMHIQKVKFTILLVSNENQMCFALGGIDKALAIVVVD